MCIKAGKFDRALSFFTKAKALWTHFDQTQSQLRQEVSDEELFSKLPSVPYSHLQFNFGNYYMHFKQAMEAAELYYTGLETSPFRFCREKKQQRAVTELGGGAEAQASAEEMKGATESAV